jgi:2-dehydro-3-deoxy-D-arabinonate dehydratase
MRIIRFLTESSVPTLAVLTDDAKIYVLPQQGFMELVQLAEEQEVTPLALVEEGVIATSTPMDTTVGELSLLTPIVAPEVWAAGVTYEKSKAARNYEATDGKLDATTFYDKVYDAQVIVTIHMYCINIY